MKLNLGCGKDYKEGWVNLDMSKRVKADVYHNIEDGLPFDDNKFEYINCKHILEHIDNFMQLMEEIYRVSKNNGIIEIESPYYKHKGAYTDPTHKRYFTENSFDYFTEKGWGKEFNFYTNVKFEIIQKKKLCSGTRSFVPRFILNFLDNFIDEMFWGIKFKLKVVK